MSNLAPPHGSSELRPLLAPEEIRDDDLADDALITEPLKIDITCYCIKFCGMATAKTYPHSKDDQIQVSGTKQRRMLTSGEPFPPEFLRSEVTEALQHYDSSL